MHRGKGCILIFFLFLFTIEGEGGGGVCFFFPRDIWVGGRRRGERGTFWVLRCFFHCGEAREGLSGGNFFYKVIMGRRVFRVHLHFFFLKV